MGAYEGAEIALVNAWVESRLQAYAEELDSEAADLSKRVFDQFAPPSTLYPFIIYQAQIPPRDIRGVGVTRVMVDTLYLVKAVAQVNSYADLGGLASIIDRAMTSAEGGAVQDGHVFACVRQEQFALTEVDAGKQYRHLGGAYKIQAQA